MPRNPKCLREFAIVLILLIALGLLYITSQSNFLLFHSLVEIFSIAIGIGIFMIAWNSKQFSENYFLLFIGISALFIGSIDFVHLLAYKGMSVFPGYDANLPTQLWIGARYLQAFSFLIALLFLSRKFKPILVFASYTAVFTILMVLIFRGIFPDCFIEETGLTAFKKYSEYIISIMLLIFVCCLYIKRSYFSKKLFTWLIIASVATIISEISFTFYVSVFGISNMTGHLMKVVAFYALYRAIVETTLINPYDNLFKNLSKRTAELNKINDQLQEEITEHEKATKELTKKSKKLEEMNDLMTKVTLDRELTMAELKKKANSKD